MPATAEENVQQLRSAGLQALAANDLPAAVRSLEAAYRLAPDGSGLFLLCRLAAAEGRTQAAKDLARRYLAELEERGTTVADADDANPGVPGVPAVKDRQEAVRILGLPSGPAGELLIFGPTAAFVAVDGRLVGATPLSQPLWLAEGQHQVVIEGAERLSGHARIISNRLVELRAKPDAGALLLTQVPAMIGLVRYAGGAEAAAPLFTRALTAAARRGHLFLLSREAALTRAQTLAACLESAACQDELAQRNEADYVLDARITSAAAPASGPAWTFALRLLSAATGELAATREVHCDACLPQRAAAQLEQEMRVLLNTATTRPLGELELISTPAGAEVWSAGRRLGVTPYHRAAEVGNRRFELRYKDYSPGVAETVVEAGKTARLSVVLRALPPRLPTRPRWRLLTGGLMIGTGVVLIGFGAAGLAVSGQCSADTPAAATECRSIYDSAPAGGALFGLGGAGVVAGGALMLWPARR